MIELRNVPVCDWCGKKHNVKSYYFCLLLPGSTKEKVFETIELCQDCQDDAYHILLAETQRRAAHD